MSTVQIKVEMPYDELLYTVEQLSLPDMERLLFQVMAWHAQRKAPSLHQDETKLLLKINQGLPVQLQMRFDILVDKRQGESLTDEEHAELLNLTHKIEIRNAQRVKYMADLARLRNMSLPSLSV